MKCDELKVHKAYNRWIDEEMPTPNDDLICNEVYLKSEADKVIAEKDEKIDELKERIDELQKATDSAWSKVNTMYDKLRYQKYRSSLAMVRWCEAEMYNILNTPLCDMNTHEVWQHDDEFWRRWCERWLELAEKFKDKEAK